MTLLLLQSMALKLRLLAAVGALTASECILVLCLLLFPLELAITGSLPFLWTARSSPSCWLVKRGLNLLEQVPRVVGHDARGRN